MYASKTEILSASILIHVKCMCDFLWLSGDATLALVFSKAVAWHEIQLDICHIRHLL